MAKIFENDGKEAWAALHRTIVTNLIGSEEPLGVIVQPLKIAERADWDTSNQLLNMYREQRIANQIPTWNALYFPAAGSNVPNEYLAFLDELNSSLINKNTDVDKDKLKRLDQERKDAQDKLQKNEFFVNQQWDRYVANNRGKPPLSRVQWETDFGYNSLRLNYQNDVRITLAAYMLEANKVGGDILEVGRVMSMISDPRQKIPLPQDENDTQLSAEYWQYWYRAGLSDDLKVFLETSSTLDISLNDESEKTHRFEERWNAGINGSYFGFFGAGGGASNETIKIQTEKDTMSIKIHFENIQSFAVDRGQWFQAGIISRFRDRMPKGFWGQAGRLNLIPTSVILIHGLKIELITSSVVTDYFFNKRSVSGSAGFNIGPWSFGGSAGRTTIEENYEMTRTGTGFTIEDKSKRAQILAVVSIRNQDLLKLSEDTVPLSRLLTQDDLLEGHTLVDLARRAENSNLESFFAKDSS